MSKKKGATWIEIIVFIGIFISISFFFITGINKNLSNEKRFIGEYSRVLDTIGPSLLILENIDPGRKIYYEEPYVIFLTDYKNSECSYCINFVYNESNRTLHIIGNYSLYINSFSIKLRFSDYTSYNSTVSCVELSTLKECKITPSYQKFLISFYNISSDYVILSNIVGRGKINVDNISYYISNYRDYTIFIYRSRGNIIERIYIK